MPTTALGALSVPTTGSESGTWGSASLNPNFVALDGYSRGVQTISLSSATTFTLSAPSGSITPGTGPTQSQNAVIKFSGTLSGNAAITLPLPGYYIIKNNCVVGSNYIQIRAVGTGNVIAAPPSEACHIYCDGTDVEYVDMGRLGELVNLCAATTPAWITACTIKPYLLCDGTVFAQGVATSLCAQLGSTFGGNGASTFGVPDLLNRVFIPMGGSSGRITVAGGNYNGASLGAGGGAQSTTVALGNLPSVGLPVAISDTRVWNTSIGVAYNNSGTGPFSTPPGGANWNMAAINIPVVSGAISGTATLGGSATPLPLMPPSLVAGITLIKT